MYVGRFVVVAPGVGGYRVSSRSFPHRRTVDRGDRIAVEPTDEAPPTDNPYVSYNCARAVEGPSAGGADDSGRGRCAVLGNGSHVDPIAEKLGLGLPPRDALAGSLLALDYEKDDYDTPRVAGIVGHDEAWIGTVRRDALLVEAVDEPTLVATYERDAPEPVHFDAGTAADAAAAVHGFDFEHPICAAGATVGDDGVEFAVHQGDDG